MATPPPARFDSCDASAGSGVREVCLHDSNVAGHSSGDYGEWIGAVCEPAVFFVILRSAFHRRVVNAVAPVIRTAARTSARLRLAQRPWWHTAALAQ